MTPFDDGYWEIDTGVNFDPVPGFSTVVIDHNGNPMRKRRDANQTETDSENEGEIEVEFGGNSWSDSILARRYGGDEAGDRGIAVNGKDESADRGNFLNNGFYNIFRR